MLGPKITRVSSMYSGCRTVINNISGLSAIKCLVPDRGSTREERCCSEWKVVRQAPRTLLNVGAVGQRKMQGGKKRNLIPLCGAIYRQLLGPLGSGGEGERERLSCCFSGWTYIKLVNVNRREIELSFVVTLMNPLPVTVNLFF